MRILLTLLMFPALAFAADHTVTSGTSTVDCDTFNGGVSAGDTITLAAGVRGSLTIQDCTGSSGNPIIVRNSSSGQTIIRRSTSTTGGNLLTLDDVQYVELDGTYAYTGKTGYCGIDNGGTEGCGIVVETTGGGAANLYVQFSGVSRNWTMRGVEINGNMATGSSGIGLMCHDATTSGSNGLRSGLLIEQNYIHSTYGEGMYCGPNWTTATGTDVMRMSGMIIRNNYVYNVGNKGISIKSVIGGINAIHDNFVNITGWADPTRTDIGAGIQMWESAATLDVYNNTVIAAGKQGIAVAASNIPSSEGSTTMDVYNNVIVRPGSLGNPTNGHGVAASQGAGTPAVTITVRNNTIVDPYSAGINFGSAVTSATSRDNIIVDVGTSAVVGGDTNTNNRTGTTAAQNFVNAGADDYQLTATSPALDSGSVSGYPDFDRLNVSRPQGSAADQGAYEYVTSGGGDALPGITSEKPDCDNYTINTGATYHPAHLWMMCEGTGATVQDEGDAVTDLDLTITGADWEADAIHDTILSCVAANSDHITNSSVASLSGTVVLGLWFRADTIPVSTGGQIIRLGDSTQDDRTISAQVESDGGIRAVSRFDAAAVANESAWTPLASGKTHQLLIRASDSTIDIAVDNNDWDTLAVSHSGLLASVDMFELCGKSLLASTGYADADIVAAALWKENIADPTAVYNSGNPWSAIGVTAGAGQIPPQRGTASFARGVKE